MSRAIITEESIRGWTRARNYMLGQEYFDIGAIYQGRRFGETLQARCQGSGTESYEVRVTIEQGKPAAGHCSCPVGGRGDCKHAAALLLTWLRQPEAFPEVSPRRVRYERLPRRELAGMLARILDAQPELELLLEPEPILPQSATAPLHPEQLRARADQLFHNKPQRWGAEGEIAEGLRGLKDFGDAFLEAGDAISAATAYDAVLRSILEHYTLFDDAEGALCEVAHLCVEGVSGILEASSEAGEREGLLWILVRVFRRDLELGGFGLGDTVPDVLCTHGTPEERALVCGWLRRALPGGEGWRERFQRKVIGELLLELEGDTLSEGDFLRLCRVTGQVHELVLFFLERDEVDAAVTEAKRAPDHELLPLAERMLAGGHDLAAEELVRSRAYKTRSLPITTWLMRRYEATGEDNLALELAMRIFRFEPSLEIYEKSREFAQRCGEWDRIRPALLDLLGRPTQATLLVSIHLAEDELDAALACLDAESEFNPGKRDRRLLIAEAAERLRPTVAVDLYREQIAWLVEHRGRDHYRQACDLLKRVRALHVAMGEHEAWARYLSAFKSQYRRLRALKDELASAQL